MLEIKTISIAKLSQFNAKYGKNNNSAQVRLQPAFNNRKTAKTETLVILTTIDPTHVIRGFNYMMIQNSDIEIKVKS